MDEIFKVWVALPGMEVYACNLITFKAELQVWASLN